MRTFCAISAIAWGPIPEQNTLASIPLSFYKDLIDYVLEYEVAPLLRSHHCDTSAPCSVLRKSMRIFISYLSVCKQWQEFVSKILKQPPYVILDSSLANEPWRGYGSYDFGMKFSLNGRYRGYDAYENDSNKSVLKAYDYGGPDGCNGRVEVVLKISNTFQQFHTEKAVYTCLNSVKSRASYVPHLYFGGSYDNPYSTYHGLVLEKLGPDLETLRRGCRNERFTPRMTLAAAIQMIGIYAMFHSQGWLHCNAKPGNFAIGPDTPGQNTRIIMFDFEYSEHILPYPKIQRSPFVGWNGAFKPISLELGLTPSRKDDLEGLGYVFSYLERNGCHPWEYIPYDVMWRKRVCIPTDKLFEGMDPAYVSYFNNVKALAWGECPKYDALVQEFVEAWEKIGYPDSPHEIDWWDEFKLRSKTY